MRVNARAFSGSGGYAMAALLVGMTIMAVFLTIALPAWSTAAKREREAELIFRGQQYARAVALFQRKYANTFPPNLDILLNEHFLRKKYKDPMTKDGEFQVLYANQQAAAQPRSPSMQRPPSGSMHLLAYLPSPARFDELAVEACRTSAAIRAQSPELS